MFYFIAIREPFFLRLWHKTPPYRSKVPMHEPAKDTEELRIELAGAYKFDFEVLGLDENDARIAADCVADVLTRLRRPDVDTYGTIEGYAADALDVRLSMALASTFIALGRNPPLVVKARRDGTLDSRGVALVKAELSS